MFETSCTVPFPREHSHSPWLCSLHGMNFVARGHFSLTFLPQSIYLHSNTSLFLNKTLENQDLVCKFITHEVHKQFYVDKCANAEKKTCKQSDLYRGLDSEPINCQICRCFTSASDSFDFHVYPSSQNMSKSIMIQPNVTHRWNA